MFKKANIKLILLLIVTFVFIFPIISFSDEINNIVVRKKNIKIGDKADYVYSILKSKDRARQPDVVQNSEHPFGLIVNQHFKVGSKLIDITFSLAGPGVNEGPYLVRKIMVEKDH